MGIRRRYTTLLTIPVLLASCSFDTSVSIAPGDAIDPVDADPLAPDAADAMPDANWGPDAGCRDPFVIRNTTETFCGLQAMSGNNGPWVVGGDITIDTDENGSDIGKTTLNIGQANNGRDIMLVAVSRLEISVGATLTITGDKPLMIVSQSDIDISGAIVTAVPITTQDQPMYCSAANVGQDGDDHSIAWDGAGGGGFVTEGGAGGLSTAKGSDPAAGGTNTTNLSLEPLRGGCPGGSSGSSANGGAGGGAFQLVAKGTISFLETAVLAAPGSAGQGGKNAQPAAPAAEEVPGGGGGGGSGGGILLQAKDIKYATGQNSLSTVFVGGGGGGGGALLDGGNGDNGAPGSKTPTIAGASGGRNAGNSNADDKRGRGGNGGLRFSAIASDGQMNISGVAGGGGGGGSGGIVVEIVEP